VLCQAVVGPVEQLYTRADSEVHSREREQLLEAGLQQSSEPLSLCSVLERAQIKKSGKLLQSGSSSCCCLCFFLFQCRKSRTRAALQIITMTMQLSSFIKCCCSTTTAATYTSVLLLVVGCCFTATLLPGSSAAVATNTSTTPEVMINLQSGLEIIRKILWSI
jgi:hypothetical protein